MKIALLKATIKESESFNKKTLESLINQTKEAIQHFIGSKEKADIITLPEYSLGYIKADTYKKGDRNSVKQILSNDDCIKQLTKYSKGKSSLIILNKTIVYDKNSDNITLFIKDGKIDHTYLKYAITTADAQLISNFSDPRGEMISKLRNNWLENKKNNKPYWWAERGLTIGTRTCFDQYSEEDLSEEADVNEKFDIKIATSLCYPGDPKTSPQPWIRERGLLINNDGWLEENRHSRLYVCQKIMGELKELNPEKDNQWFKTYKAQIH